MNTALIIAKIKAELTVYAFKDSYYNIEIIWIKKSKSMIHSILRPKDPKTL